MKQKMLSFVGLVFVWIVLLESPGAFGRTKKNGIIKSLQNGVESILVQAPKDQETCFSPNDPCDLKLVKFIDQAEKSIDMAIYDINLDQLVHKLLTQSKKIQVRILCDKRQAKGNHSLVNLLIKGGANVRFGRQRGIMHNKFTIIDQKAVELGSFNYTRHASIANRENQLYLWSPSVVERYVQEFNKIWNDGTSSEAR